MTDRDHTHDHPGTARWRSLVQGAAATLELEAPGVDTVRAAARHRVRRQQRVTAGIASVAVVAGAVGVSTVVAREPGVSLDGAVGSPSSGVTFEWVSDDVVLAAQPQIVQAPDGVLYALSTAPGVTRDDVAEGTSLPQSVYRSTDGLSWEATDLDPALQLATFDVAPDGLLYGLSTAPGDASVRLATSADGGSSWALDELPPISPHPRVANGVQLTAVGTQVDAARRGDTSVVTVHQEWIVEPGSLGVLGDGQSGWVVATDAGLEVHADALPPGPTPTGPPPVGPTPYLPSPEARAAQEAAIAPTPMATPSPEVVAVIPWHEIGLAGPKDLAITQTFTSTEDTWVPVDPGPQGAAAAVEATAEGFLAILHDPAQDLETATPVQVARSADGLTWTLDPAPVTEAIWVQDVGTAGDRILIAAALDRTSPELNEDVAVFSSADAGRTWTTTDLDGLVEGGDGPDVWFQPGDIGPLGIVVVAVDHGLGPGWDTTLLYSPDGITWDHIPPEDAGIGERTGIGWVSVDADRILLTTYETDTPTRTAVGIPTR